MVSECAYGLLVSGGCVLYMALGFLVFPIVYLQGPELTGFDIDCNYSQPEFRIVPLDISKHSSVTFHVYNYSKWPNGFSLGLYDPEENCSGPIINSRFIHQYNFNCDNEYIQPVGYFSLARGAVINISFKAIHSISLFLFRRNDIDYIPYDEGDTDTRFKEKNTVRYDPSRYGGFDYSRGVISKALFKCHNRSCDVSWIAPETTQYVIAFGNDSPFVIRVTDCRISLQSPSPIVNNPVGICSTEEPFCNLSVPDSYNKDVISIVAFNDCKKTDYVHSYLEFDVSLDVILGLSLGYFLPCFIGLSLLLAGFILCLIEWCHNCSLRLHHYSHVPPVPLQSLNNDSDSDGDNSGNDEDGINDISDHEDDDIE